MTKVLYVSLNIILALYLFHTFEQLIVATVAAVAAADSQYYYRPPETHAAPAASARSEFVEVVPILRDERVHSEDGSYSYVVETGNGIAMSQSGSPTGPEGAVIKAGEYS